MSVFHYRADFIKEEGNSIYYKFRPDFIDFENVVGEFKINLENWQPEIVLDTEIAGRDSIHCNERPVSALTYRIQKYFEENNVFPKEVFFVA